MRRKYLWYLAPFLFIPLSLTNAQDKPPNSTNQQRSGQPNLEMKVREMVKVEENGVVDGDTFRAERVELEEPIVENVRFDRINTPEWNEPGGQEAKKRVKKFVKQYPSIILVKKKDKRDKYNRLLGHPHVYDGTEEACLQKLLIEEGFGCLAYTRSLGDDACGLREAQKRAIDFGRGIWKPSVHREKLLVEVKYKDSADYMNEFVKIQLAPGTGEMDFQGLFLADAGTNRYDMGKLVDILSENTIIPEGVSLVFHSGQGTPFIEREGGGEIRHFYLSDHGDYKGAKWNNRGDLLRISGPDGMIVVLAYGKHLSDGSPIPRSILPVPISK